MKRVVSGSIRSQIRAIREAYAARPYEPPPWNDPVAVRYEDARRVYEFVKLKREAEGATGPYRYDSVAAVYQLAERMDAEREAEAAAQREGGEE
jgi:hypothetical protein